MVPELMARAGASLLRLCLGAHSTLELQMALPLKGIFLRVHCPLQNSATLCLAIFLPVCIICMANCSRNAPSMWMLQLRVEWSPPMASPWRAKYPRGPGLKHLATSVPSKHLFATARKVVLKICVCLATVALALDLTVGLGTISGYPSSR